MNYALLKNPDRLAGFTRRPLRQDVLYNYFRYRDISLSVSKKTRTVTRFTDSFIDQLAAAEIITSRQKNDYLQAVLHRFNNIDQQDDVPVELIYSALHQIRKDVLGADVVDQFASALAENADDFVPNGIDQTAQKQQLIDRCQTLLFVLTDVRLWKQFRRDLAQAQGKQVYVVDTKLVPQQLLPRELLAPRDLSIDPNGTGILFYGEEGLLCCHGLCVDAAVHCSTDSYHVQAMTGLWDGQKCTVLVPKNLEILRYVPLTAKTRLNYNILWRLWQTYGDRVYRMTIRELYQNYPQFFVNVYSGSASRLPLQINARDLQDFDRQLDAAMCQYFDGFPNARYISTYFDETLNEVPICYDGQPQSGILVQAAKIKKASGAQVLRCEKGVTPRKMFKAAALPGTALVSNFLFFMTPKLGNLYNDLRQDRPPEQADAASGHLDYMKSEGSETFPLFCKACIGMKEDGRFLFFNFRLGGGTVTLGNISYRWEKTDVDNDRAAIRVYTPFYSAQDEDADRDTYRKAVGVDRVNVILLRDKITCIRKGDVLLPSVGIVLSLTQDAAAPLLQACQPLEDGYYNASGLSLKVSLDPPEGIDHKEWASVRWAYGGGLTLIRDGIGLCDGDNMNRWFRAEGWTSPLSRQTQESNLHSLVKHPRTAIGCTADGSLVVLVFSGRTWRSTGADYAQMITIARKLFPDIRFLMNCDGGGSAMLGMVTDGEFQELSFPSTSSGSCAGQVRPINTVFYIPVE